MNNKRSLISKIPNNRKLETSTKSDDDSDSDNSDSDMYSSGEESSEEEMEEYDDFKILVSCVLHGSGYKIKKNNNGKYDENIIDDVFVKLDPNKVGNDNVSINRNTIPFHLLMSNDDVHKTVDDMMFYLKDVKRGIQPRGMDSWFQYSETMKMKKMKIGKKKIIKKKRELQEKTHQQYKDIRDIFYFLSQDFPKNEVFFNESLSTELEKRKSTIEDEFWIKVVVYGSDEYGRWDEIGDEDDKAKLILANKQNYKINLLTDTGSPNDIPMKTFVENIHDKIKKFAIKYMKGLKDNIEITEDAHNNFMKKIKSDIEYKYVFHTCSPPNKIIISKPLNKYAKKNNPDLTSIRWKEVLLSMLIDVGRIFLYHKGLHNMSKKYQSEDMPDYMIEDDDNFREGNLNIMEYDDRQENYIKVTTYMRFIFLLQYFFRNPCCKNNCDTNFIKDNINKLINKFVDDNSKKVFQDYQPIHFLHYLLYQYTHLPYNTKGEQQDLVPGIMSSYVSNDYPNPKKRKDYHIFNAIVDKTNSLGSMIVGVDGEMGIKSNEIQNVNNESSVKTIKNVSHYFLDILHVDIVYDINKSRFDNHKYLIDIIRRDANNDFFKKLEKSVMNLNSANIENTEDGYFCAIMGGGLKGKKTRKRNRKKPKKTRRRKPKKSRRRKNKKTRRRKNKKTGGKKRRTRRKKGGKIPLKDVEEDWKENYFKRTNDPNPATQPSDDDEVVDPDAIRRDNAIRRDVEALALDASSDFEPGSDIDDSFGGSKD